jgi:hypothetical protein
LTRIASVALEYLVPLAVIAGNGAAFLTDSSGIDIIWFAFDAAAILWLLIVGRRLGLVIGAALAFLQTAFILLSSIVLFLTAGLLLVGLVLSNIVRVVLNILAYPLVLLLRRKDKTGAPTRGIRQQAAVLLIGFVPGLLLGLMPADGQQLPEEPRSSVTVLVDLSATWLTPGSRSDNESILKIVATSIEIMASDLELPIMVRYLPIGDLSVGRPALCEVLFIPKLLRPPEGKIGEVTSLPELKFYLEKSCLQYILSRKQEKFTDITSALDNAVRVTDEQLGNFKRNHCSFRP